MNVRNAEESPHRAAGPPQVIEWNGNDMTIFDRNGEVIESRIKRRPVIRPESFRPVGEAARMVAKAAAPVVVIVARATAEVSLVALAIFGQVALGILSFVWHLLAGIVTAVLSARAPRMENDRTSYRREETTRNITINITNNINIK